MAQRGTNFYMSDKYKKVPKPLSHLCQPILESYLASACRAARQQSTRAPSNEAPYGSPGPWPRSYAASRLSLVNFPMTEVRRRDPRSTLFGLCTSAGPAMKAAPAILLVGRTLTRGAPPCLRTAPPPRPIRPKTPLDTDGHIVFCQHE